VSHADGGWHRHSFAALEEGDSVIELVAASMSDAAYPEEDILSIRLAMQEAFINAVTHGNANHPAKRVEVCYRVGGQGVLVKVEDQGRGFNPDAVPDPRDPENLERLGGRGIFLMRAAMTWTRFNERGNCVTLCKYRSAC
jgi:serine/threonine-protein kinase RsbW